MHLADGVLTHTGLWLGLSAVGAGAVALALRGSVVERGAETVPELGQVERGAAWTGTLAAFALAVQAINVPVLFGASAHALGAGLLAACLPAARAIVALFVVLLVQALLFADGGITVLFVNALTIAVIPVLCVRACRRGLGRASDGRTPAWSVGVGTWLGNTLGAVTLATILVLGADAPVAATFGWLAGVQAVAAVVEGVLTVLAVRYLARRAPRLLQAEARNSEAARPRSPVVRLAFALGIALLLVPLASSAPDALEVVVRTLEPR